MALGASESAVCASVLTRGVRRILVCDITYQSKLTPDHSILNGRDSRLTVYTVDPHTVSVTLFLSPFRVAILCSCHGSWRESRRHLIDLVVRLYFYCFIGKFEVCVFEQLDNCLTKYHRTPWIGFVLFRICVNFDTRLRNNRWLSLTSLQRALLLFWFLIF